MTPNDDLDPPRPPFAAIMFWLAFAYLLTVAGVIHRAHQADISNFEEWVLAVSLLILWPLFPAEAIYTARRRHESQPSQSPGSRATDAASFSAGGTACEVRYTTPSAGAPGRLRNPCQ